MKNSLDYQSPEKECCKKIESFLSELGIIDRINEIFDRKKIPTWAREDILIKKMIDENIGCFITCQEILDENIDELKPIFHRGFIYFDGNKYYIKRWKLKYINGVPFRSKGFSSEEFFVIGKNNYGDLNNFIKNCLLFREYEQ